MYVGCRNEDCILLKKICDLLSALIFLFLAVTAGMLFVPKLFGYSQYAVLSGSMEPQIPVGAMIYDKPFSEQDLKEGMVVTYELSGGTMVTHRVVSIDFAARTLETQGDANEMKDAAAVSFDQIAGICTFDVPYLGYLSLYAKTPLGITAVCAVLALVILLNFIPEFFGKNVFA